MMSKGVWRNGSASDSRSEGWEFDCLCPHGKLHLYLGGVIIFALRFAVFNKAA